MLELLAHLIVTAALLMLVANMVNGIHIDGWGSAFLAAIMLGVVNAVVRPLMILLTIPITVLTLGLFLFVINALMLWLAAALAPGFRIQGFGPALLGSLILTVLNILIAAAFGAY
ncbi:MAG: phage holin family protein [Gammaproteobacteria bacterium]|jgi:putative membrane protein|nr:phage holin family protein [Gammaproteobacteria bacterium]